MPTPSSKWKMGRWSYVWIAMLTLMISGCLTASNAMRLPSRHRQHRGQVVLHSNRSVVGAESLVKDLELRRKELSNLLGITPSDDPIEVYLFENEGTLRQFMAENHPDFPYRRALFVKDEERLCVYAAQTSRLGEDLRHEVTHGYLHSAIDGIPLWLDEGLAEFFEVKRGLRGLNASHVFLLANELEQGRWRPNLRHLESVIDPALMTRIDYAEAWLWVHFLLTHPDANRRPIIQAHLQMLRTKDDAFAISAAIEQELPKAESMLLQHLEEVRQLGNLDRQPTWN